MEKTSIHLENCPFCGLVAIIDVIKPDFDALKYQCGCSKVTCRGYYHNSPLYYDIEVMATRWNKRPNDVI